MSQDVSPLLLVICDGMGLNPDQYMNAVYHAKTPHLDNLLSTCPNVQLQASGEHVGLPAGVMGNSEVGHLNIGAGRPVRQDFVRLNEALENNSYETFPRFQELIKTVKEGNNRLHLMILLSDGGVHSHQNHLYKNIEILNANGITPYIHAFMDGRDTPQDSGIKYLNELFSNGELKFHFASMQGRSIGMDRDRRWDKIQKAYDCLTGKISPTKKSPLDYIKEQYQLSVYDEFIEPALFMSDGAINHNDAVFFLNFRPDRTKQITLCLNDPDFSFFPVDIKPRYFLCMTPYVDEELPTLPILLDREKVHGTLSEVLSAKNLKQFKIAETEKYAHVTYFFNGGHEKAFAQEQRVLVNSPRDVKTYDEKPQMSAYEVYEKLQEALNQKSADFYLVNFANPDMVGHTGNFEAAIKAMEVIDDILGKLIHDCTKNKINLLITADHGNCDQMAYANGEPQTSHSLSLVPFIFKSFTETKVTINTLNRPYALQDIAPSVMTLMNLEISASFTGKNIFTINKG